MIKETALRIAKKIISNLKDRSGMFEIDDEIIEEEIEEEIANTIMDNAN